MCVRGNGSLTFDDFVPAIKRHVWHGGTTYCITYISTLMHYLHQYSLSTDMTLIREGLHVIVGS